MRRNWVVPTEKSKSVLEYGIILTNGRNFAKNKDIPRIFTELSKNLGFINSTKPKLFFIPFIFPMGILFNRTKGDLLISLTSLLK